jgi:hypothetical protein
MSGALASFEIQAYSILRTFPPKMMSANRAESDDDTVFLSSTKQRSFAQFEALNLARGGLRQL